MSIVLKAQKLTDKPEAGCGVFIVNLYNFCALFAKRYISKSSPMRAENYIGVSEQSDLFCNCMLFRFNDCKAMRYQMVTKFGFIENATRTTMSAADVEFLVCGRHIIVNK